MKIIVSHDVDHLNVREHLKDLYFPKLWVRSFLELIHHKISLKTFWNRLVIVFSKRIHRIPELCEYDRNNGVKATYFFGMAHALGMVYNPQNALPWIRYVELQGNDVGVHGCDYQHLEAICKEHDSFVKLTGNSSFGIRNHYVRYDDDTFNKMNCAGYIFDSSEFNKEKPTYKKPYKVGDLWEFPLAIMDGYVVHYDLEESKKIVVGLIKNCLDNGSDFLTVLFHDSYFNNDCYPVEKAFYEWFIKYVKSLGIEFVSYKEAIKELDNEK